LLIELKESIANLRDSYRRRGINLVRERIQICNPEITHRGLKRFVAEHELNRPDGNLLGFPIAGASLAEPMQVMMLANRMRFAGCLNLA